MQTETQTQNCNFLFLGGGLWHGHGNCPPCLPMHYRFLKIDEIVGIVASFWRSRGCGQKAGVISRGLRGQSPLLKITDHFGGSALLKFSHCPCFSSLLTLLPKHFLLLYLCMHCYMVIKTCLIVDYTISVLN